MGHYCTGEEEGGADVNIEDCCVVLCCHVCDGLVVQHASIVDKDVDLVSEGLLRGFYDLFGCIKFAEVGLDRCRCAAVVERFDLGCDFLGQFSALGRSINQCELSHR